MKEEELKKAIEDLHLKRNQGISEDIWKRFQNGECNLISNLVNEVFDLIKYTSELESKRAELKGFKAGQLAEREKFYYWLFDLKKGQKKWSTYQLIKIQKKLEELTQKINSQDNLCVGSYPDTKKIKGMKE